MDVDELGTLRVVELGVIDGVDVFDGLVGVVVVVGG